MEVNAKLVGIRIMQKRKEYGYSQEKLAELIDISKNHLSSIECGHNLPTIKVSTKICNVLGGTLDYYCFGKIEQQNKEQIIQLFQQLSQDEQNIAMELIKTYIDNKYKFD